LGNLGPTAIMTESTNLRMYQYTSLPIYQYTDLPEHAFHPTYGGTE
jgi:hypothetical protein